MANETTLVSAPTLDSAGVPLGLRVEFWSQAADVGDRELFAALTREDLLGAAVPTPGDHIAPASLGRIVSAVAGLDLTAHHVEHYFHVPGVKDWTPLSTVVIKAEPSRTPDQTRELLRAELDELTETGWHVDLMLNREGAAR